VLIAAPFLGSFMATAAARAPTGFALVFGRSECRDCRHRLTFVDLVPIVSWLVLSGRCRHCRAIIGIFYPAAEIAALALTGIAVSILSGVDVMIACALGWTLLLLSLIDLRHQVLPDSLTLPLALLGLAVAWFDGYDMLLDGAVGCVTGFVLFYFISISYRRLRGREGLGLGDAKLFAAGGAWVAWQGLASVVLVASVAALMVAGLQAMRGSLRADNRIPFGLYLGPAIWLIWLIGPLYLT
tara:strand:- start:368 stop:1090 length:723 start_codon:yes stop_codon:yes gene_type:complete